MAGTQSDSSDEDDASGSWERELEVVDAYLKCREHGERPTNATLADRFPDLPSGVRRMFPVLSMLEDAAEVQASAVAPDSSRPETNQNAQNPPQSEATIPDEFGRYRVERLIGKGAMGTVYLAHDQHLERSVALKIPRFQDGDAALIKRFSREALSMAMVEHPNLCPVYDVGELDGVHFLAMAYIDGTSLADFVETQTTIPEEDAAWIVMQLARGLHVAHQAGIVHRDVKPSNVILRADGEPVLMDFGLAQWQIDGAAQLTRDGAIVGSPAYMSPEQIESGHDHIGPRTDVYSLGVVLFELLCRRRPFEGTPLAVLRDIKWTDPPRPTSIRADIDPRLEAICLKAMAKNPADRFASAADLADVLEQYLGFRQAGESARNVTATRLGRPRIRSLVAAALLVLAVVATATYLLRRGPAPHREETALSQETTTPPDILTRRPIPTERHDAWLLPSEPTVKARSTGEFYLAQTLGGNSERQHVALADVDGDEDLDAFITSRSPEPLASRLWLNDGSGNFSDSGQRFEFDGYVYGLAFGDFDADGDFDAYVSCLGADRLLTSEGGVFTDSGQQLNFPDTRRAALGDLDGDGDLDVYLPSESFEIPDLVLTNDGKGHLADTGQRIAAEPTRRVTLGDFDGDGDLDVYRANLTMPDSLWLNDGNGYFESRKRSFAAALESHAATVFDADGDNDLDILVADNQNPSRIWINDGEANFTLIELPQLGIHATDFTMGDLNGDGVMDAWVSRGNWRAGYSTRPATNLVWLRGDSPETGTTQNCGIANSLNAALGDLDGDGDLDAVVANHETPAEVWINRNIGEHLPRSMQPRFVDNGQRLGNDKSKDIALGDMDLDGDLDAFVSNERGPDRVWYNDGTGQFEASSQELGEKEHSNGAALGDFDGDGRQDVIVGGSYGAPLCIWMNHAGGQFTKAVPDKTANWMQRVALHDFDNDGDLDAILACEDPPQSLLWNEGNGQFTRARLELPHDGRMHAMQLADMDQDGDLDVLIGCANPGGVYIWHNEGKGVFTDAGKWADEHWVHGIAVADVNGDGTPDFATANPSFPTSLWLNQGDGTFSGTDQELNQYGGWDIKFGDLDNDGDNDLICANGDDEPLVFHLNDGHGRFGAAELLENGMTSKGLALGDLDNDGDLDVFVANDGPNRVWLNQTVE